MSGLARECVLQLAPGCRLNSAGGSEDFLLIPEGALRLKGRARNIVELCDGIRTVGQIVIELQQRFAGGDAIRIESDTIALLGRLFDRGALKPV